MKFFVLALLLACLEGYFCAPFLEIFVPDSSSFTYGRQTTFDIGNLVHLQNNRDIVWNVKWPERNPRRHDGYPPQGYEYPQQGYGYQQQGYGYPQQNEEYPQEY